MTIAKRDQDLLNNFPDSQIGLQRPGELPSSAGIPLGDILAETSSYGAKQGVYSFAVQGGSIGVKPLTCPFLIPAYSTIDKVIVRVQTAVAPNTGLTAVLNVIAGGTTTALQSFVAGGLSTVGSTQSLIAAPVYIGSQPGRLALTLAGAAATAGIVTFIVTYTSTVQLPK